MSETEPFSMDKFNETLAETVHKLATGSHIRDLDTPILSHQPSDEARSVPLSGITVGAGTASGAVLVPSLTQEQVGTNVSSNGKRMVAINTPAGISTAEFRSALAGAYMQYVATGAVTLDGVAERTSINPVRVGLIIAAPEFGVACEVRGIDAGGIKRGITPEQDYALQIILDTTDGLSFGRKLKKAGISNSKWQAWLKNPLIAKQYQLLTAGLLNDSAPAILQLVGKANEGDLGAIKFMLEVNGRHNPNRDKAVDVLSAMNQIMEVIFRNVKDHDELVAIAAEMKIIGERMGLNSQRQIEG